MNPLLCTENSQTPRNQPVPPSPLLTFLIIGSRYHFLQCLDPRKRNCWDEECFARAQFLYAGVLKELGRADEAEKYLAKARETKDRYVAEYPQWLRKPEEDSELAVFDLMCCQWAGRYTGKLKQKTDDVEMEGVQQGMGDLLLDVDDEAGGQIRRGLVNGEISREGRPEDSGEDLRRPDREYSQAWSDAQTTLTQSQGNLATASEPQRPP